MTNLNDRETVLELYAMICTNKYLNNLSDFISIRKYLVMYLKLFPY